MAGASPEVAGLLAQRVPPAVAAALGGLAEELTRAAAGNLVGLVLYGGLARGRYRPGASDVNVAVILRDASAAGVAPLVPSLRAAFRAVRVEPLLLAAEEIQQAADVFPTKLLDIQAHHLLIAGEDPFVGLTVEREHIRLRVEQELRNLTLRLRRQLVAASGDEHALASRMSAAVVPLSVELTHLLSLVGAPPAEDTPPAVFQAAAAAFQLDGEALARAASLKLDGRPDRDVADLYARFLAAVQRAAAAVQDIFSARDPHCFRE